MGGTSTDVSLFSETYEFVDSTEIGGVRLRSPMLRVHTIAAGGSSILGFNAGRYQVGPQSAGADPGPASYRRGGPLTLTDANVLLGRILPDYFPKVFGPVGDQTLDSRSVADLFDQLADDIGRQTDKNVSVACVAEGFIRVAVENMANAIKKVSVQRGHDPGNFTLCCFGGAGGQHACQVADRLGIKSIMIDPLAGVLSAYGIGVAPIRAYRQQTVEKRVSHSTTGELQPTVKVLESACFDEVESQGIDAKQIVARTIVQVKIAGTDSTVAIPWGKHGDIVRQFALIHEQRYGFSPHEPDLIIESLRVEATGETGAPLAAENVNRPNTLAACSKGKVRAFFNTGWHQTPVFKREDFSPGF
jgi:5-oxoprolinase (ATP-hydrolysing)